ncbi:MAG: AAA family ATPase [Roseicyclus sp.]
MSAALPVCRAADLGVRPPEQRWLVERLWAERAVGIVGGEPKCCKSFLALDVAVSVASGRPCLRRYPVRQPGPVLLFAAEDALHVVRERVTGICAAAGVDLDSLPLHVITAPTVRLDLARDQKRLRHTVEQLRPRLLVLDPFVRLHRVDENAAADVAPLLAYLRQLERELETAVLLVHHARKGAAHARAGQALRGSSELHAWGDSNLYLRRRGEALLMAVEHRAAAPIEALALELRAERDALALRIVEDAAVTEERDPPTAHERVEAALANLDEPVSRRELRAECRMRMATLCEALNDLVEAGRVVERDGRFVLVSP